MRILFSGLSFQNLKIMLKSLGCFLATLIFVLIFRLGNIHVSY